MSNHDSRKNTRNYQNVNIAQSCLDLSRFMAESPGDIDYSLIKRGQNLLALFFDQNFTDSFQNLAELKKEMLLLAAEDIAKGVISLRSSVLGISFLHSKLKTYVIPHGSAPDGSVVFSISWKHIRSFQNWRNEDTADIDQEDLNACLYLISYELSKIKW
jgi:hypothetical protein